MIDKARMDDFLHTNSWTCPVCGYVDPKHSINVHELAYWHYGVTHTPCREDDCPFLVSIKGRENGLVESFTVDGVEE